MVNEPKSGYKFLVTVGGAYARKRWPDRYYKLRSSARRRAKQIHDAHDMSVATIWIINTDSRYGPNGMHEEQVKA